jgi:hypothetical protein
MKKESLGGFAFAEFCEYFFSLNATLPGYFEPDRVGIPAGRRLAAF